MNVLYIADVGETGGATKSLMELIYNLNRDYDINPIVITSNIGKVTQYCNKNNFITIASGHRAFYISKGQTTVKKLIKFFLIPYYFVEYKIKNILAINKIVKSVDIDNVDIIHSNVNRNDIGALLAKKYNISYHTIQNWIDKINDGKSVSPDNHLKGRKKDEEIDYNEQSWIMKLATDWGFRDSEAKKMIRWTQDFNDLLAEAIEYINKR